MNVENQGLSRRRFLRRGLLGSFVLGAGGLAVYQQSGYALASAVLADLKVFGAKEYLIFEAAAARLLASDQAGAPTPEELGVARFADGYLARQPAWMQRDVCLLLQVLEHSPPLFDLVFSRFTRQDPDQQDAVLKAWSESRLDVRRQGFTALKGLCVMAYYRHEASWGLLGYDGPLIRDGKRRGY